MGDAENVLSSIARFNRKERFYLISFALAHEELETVGGSIPLGPILASKLSEASGIASIPTTAVWSMDYHLDWLYAALVHARGDESPLESPFVNDKNEPYNLNTNQEDIDLLVVFKQEEGIHLVLVEAKGYTPFGVPQLRSKARRLKSIFTGSAGGYGTFEGLPVRASFVLASRKPSAGLNKWVQSKEGEQIVPRWMLNDKGELRHFILPMPLASERLRPKRRKDPKGPDGLSQHLWDVVPGDK